MAEAPAILVNDAVRRQVLLEGIKRNEANDFQKFLKELEKDIRNRLSKEGSTITTKARLNILLKDIRKTETDVFDRYLDDINETLEGVATTEGELEAESLSDGVEDFDAVKPAPAQLITAFKNRPLSIDGRAAGLTLEPFLKGVTDEQKDLIEGAIRQGFAEGQTTNEIIQRIRGTRANKFKDGILSNVDRNITAMVRTAVQNTSSAARQRTWDANSDLIQGVEWVSTLDSRTTPQCRALDGEIFPVDSGPRPPIHYGCRSTTAPVLSEEFDAFKVGEKRPAKGAEDTTQVKSTTTYYSWLKTQPASFQDKILGPTRGKLLRSGGLSSEKFAALQLNNSFDPITLDEMVNVSRESRAAFRKANLLDDDGNVIIQ